jgi:hypothetical protein
MPDLFIFMKSVLVPTVAKNAFGVQLSLAVIIIDDILFLTVKIAILC